MEGLLLGGGINYVLAFTFKCEDWRQGKKHVPPKLSKDTFLKNNTLVRGSAMTESVAQ